MINSAGGVVASRTYDAYGATTASTGTLLEPFGYTGAYTDSSTGLIKLGARYYDPSLGRFTQTDPETHAGDPNQGSPYPYAADDPINHTDPTGRFSTRCGVAAGIATAGGALVGGFIGFAAGGPAGSAIVAPIVGGAAGGAVAEGCAQGEAGESDYGDIAEATLFGAGIGLVGLTGNLPNYFNN